MTSVPRESPNPEDDFFAPVKDFAAFFPNVAMLPIAFPTIPPIRDNRLVLAVASSAF